MSKQGAGAHGGAGRMQIAEWSALQRHVQYVSGTVVNAVGVFDREQTNNLNT